MISSIATGTSTSLHAPHHYSQVDPLTADLVIKKTYLKHEEQVSFRCMGNLFWCENEYIASLNGRIDFINTVTSNVIEAIQSRDTPLTFISLGSGGLLTEYFIHEQLKKSGYTDLSWRVIDLDYQNNGYERSIKEFKEKVIDNVKTFITERAYLDKPYGHSLLADDDKHRGAIVVLSIAPPNALVAPSAKVNYGPDCMFIRGRPMEDDSKANGIYLLVANNAYKQMISEVPAALSYGEQVAFLDCVLKCSVSKSGHYDVTFSSSESGHFMNNGVTPYLESLRKIIETTGRKIELSHLNRAFGKYLESLEGSGISGLKFYVSDYDTSLVKLHNQFINSRNPTMFASFDKNNGSCDLFS